MANQHTLDTLHAAGFDRSTRAFERHTSGHAYFSVACSQCEALVINGTPCHETGCPNQVYECRGCTAQVSRRGAYCPNCQ